MRNRLWACALALVLAVSGLHAQTKEMVSLREEAAQAVKKGRVAAADSLYRQYVRLYDAGGYDKNFDYSEVLCWLVNRDVQLGKIDEAIALQQQVAEVRRTATDCTYGQWAVATSDLASLFSRKGNYEKAIELGEEALRMLKEKFGPKHNYYCVALANQASYYAARGYQGDYERAVTMSEEAIKHLKKSSPEYVNAVNQLVVFYIQTGNKAKASLLAQQTLKETTKMAGQASAGGAVVLNNNAIRLANSGNYAGALDLMHIAKSYYDSSGQTISLAYGKILTNMATFCSHLHQYKEAAALLEQAMPVIAKAANQQHPDYLRCVSDLADVYKAMGNLEDAGDLALLSEQISQSMGQQDNVKYGKSPSSCLPTSVTASTWRLRSTTWPTISSPTGSTGKPWPRQSARWLSSEGGASHRWPMRSRSTTAPFSTIRTSSRNRPWTMGNRPLRCTGSWAIRSMPTMPVSWLTMRCSPSLMAARRRPSPWGSAPWHCTASCWVTPTLTTCRCSTTWPSTC